MNDAERCRRNGWTVGDVLQETYGLKIRLTAIGEERVFAATVFEAGGSGEEGEVNLSYSRWRKVGRWNKRTRKVVKL